MPSILVYDDEVVVEKDKLPHYDWTLIPVKAVQKGMPTHAKYWSTRLSSSTKVEWDDEIIRGPTGTA